MSTLEQISERLEKVEGRIEAAALRAGRDPNDVQLIVVTKGHPAETIRNVIKAGARLLGENYADHAVPKITELGKTEAAWHMIGHVQSRKAKLVSAHFDMVHSLDSVKLARRLHSSLPPDKKMPVLLQLNVSGETQKFGIPAWDAHGFQQVSGMIEQISAFENLKIRGFMTMPPFLPPDQVRPYFQRLAELREQFAVDFPGLSLNELSMGMSGDYEAAVEEGATFVRVGTAILGPRSM